MAGEIRNWETVELLKHVIHTQVQGPKYGFPMMYLQSQGQWHMHAYYSSVRMPETGVSLGFVGQSV